MRALVVDDSSVARKVLIGILRHDCGFDELIEAGDGAQALDIVKSEDFDLILLDWNMPNLKGIDALRGIRELGNKTPVIMVTSEQERVRVVEAFGAGANNYIVKPIAPKVVAKKVNETISRAISRPARERSRRALIADDSSVVRQLLTGMLTKNCGFGEVVQANDGEQAVEESKKGLFDVILLDWNMPKMTGLEALKVIRESDKTTPVVIVTGEKDGARVVEAFDAGANNYILKPFEPSTVADKIDQVMADHF